jgi:hypothetical protein
MAPPLQILNVAFSAAWLEITYLDPTKKGEHTRKVEVDHVDPTWVHVELNEVMTTLNEILRMARGDMRGDPETLSPRP